MRRVHGVLHARARVTADVLTARHLNRAMLARQLLLDRSDLSLTDAVEQIGGLQTQYAPSGYISLWSRLRDFDRPMLTQGLEDRRVIQGTMMRVTIHTVSAGDYWPMAEAVREARRSSWLRTPIGRGVTTALMEAAAAAVREELADGPMRWGDLRRRLKARDLPADGVGLWVDLVRVPPSGTWERRRADLYGLADEWLPRQRSSAHDGQELLVRRYLGAYGPARPADIASWAGVGVRSLLPIVERLELHRFRDEQGRELIDLPDAPLPDLDTPVPVRFLAVWDPMLLAHARRTQILREEHRDLIFSSSAPQSVNTFLVDGQVAGIWRPVDGGIVTEPFEALSATVQRAVDDEADRLAQLMD